MLQSLRLWNRAIDTLVRLRPSKPSVTETNPFDDSDTGQDSSHANRHALLQSLTDGLEWQAAEGLLDTLLSLERLYAARGSVREAEHFARQAQDLAESLNAPTMKSRALARVGEILLRLGNIHEGNTAITEAAELVQDVFGPDRAEIHRLHGQVSEMSADKSNARNLYEAAMSTLQEVSNMLMALDE